MLSSMTISNLLGRSNPEPKKPKRDKKLITRHGTFYTFFRDFLHHLSSGKIDIYTWYTLRKKILTWYNEVLDAETKEELEREGIKKEVLFKHLRSADQFQNYLLRFNQPIRNKLIGYFLLDTFHSLGLSKDLLQFESQIPTFYQAMADGLDIVLYHVDHQYNSKKYVPISNEHLFKDPITRIILDENTLDEYLAGLLEIKRLVKTEQMTIAKIVQNNQVYINQKVKLANTLLSFSPLLHTPQECLASIDACINKIYLKKSHLNSRFMLGSYPKEVNEAIRIFNELGAEENLNFDYQEYKKNCSSISNRALRQTLSELLDQAYIVACNERILDKKGKLFIRAKEFLGRINIACNNIHSNDDGALKKSYSKLKDDLRVIQKSYGGFSKRVGRLGDIKRWFQKQSAKTKTWKRNIKNFWRNLFRDNKVNIDDLKPDAQQLGRCMEQLHQTILANEHANLTNHNYKLIKLPEPKASKPAELSRSEKLTNAIYSLYKKKTISTPPQQETTSTPPQPRELFAKLLYTAPKVGGAKPGGNFDMLGSDEIQRRFMIKQGKTLGETLAEFLAYLHIKPAANQQSSAAKTHLVIQDPKTTNTGVKRNYANLEEFSKHVFVASQYATNAEYSVEAFRLEGHTDKPILADTLGREVFNICIELNRVCGLGLEYPIENAIDTCDYDLHSANLLLVFSVKNITNEADLLYAHELINKISLSIEQGRLNLTDLTKNILKIKELGGSVYFRKIDHGLAFFEYRKKKLSLENSHTSPMGSKGLQATNHIAEWTNKGKGQNLLLSDEGCKHYVKKDFKSEIEKITSASQEFYQYISEAATHYPNSNSTDEIKKNKAEYYLLNALYVHITGTNHPFYPAYMKDINSDISLDHFIKSIKADITAYLIVNRIRIMKSHDEQYLSWLSEIRVKSASQIAVEEFINNRKNSSTSVTLGPEVGPAPSSPTRRPGAAAG